MFYQSVIGKNALLVVCSNSLCRVMASPAYIIILSYRVLLPSDCFCLEEVASNSYPKVLLLVELLIWCSLLYIIYKLVMHLWSRVVNDRSHPITLIHSLFSLSVLITLLLIHSYFSYSYGMLSYC